MCIQLHGWRSDLVMLDPFLGIGNSAAAALEAEIGRFVGFEIDDEYLKTAKEIIGRLRTVSWSAINPSVNQLVFS
jgi:site-specific DNA-methyltransferase (adenine-specific)